MDAITSRRAIEVIDSTPTQGSDLFLDREAEEVFYDWVGKAVEECEFERVRVSLDAIQGGRYHSPEMYLSDGDEEGYEIALSLQEAYERGDDVPPIIICELEGIDGWSVPDGCHRLVAANAAGLDSVEAFRLIS